MESKYQHFNLRNIVGKLRKNIDRQYKMLAYMEHKTKEDRQALQICSGMREEIRSISDDMGIEDLPLYEEYLGKFDIGLLLRDFPIATNPENMAADGDLDILLRLIFATNIGSYDMTLDKERNKVVVSVTVDDETIQVDQMEPPQIRCMISVYLEMEFRREACRKLSDLRRRAVDTEREQKIKAFNKNIRKLRNQMEIDELLAKLDALLKS